MPNSLAQHNPPFMSSQANMPSHAKIRALPDLP
jgi:hypothetical protein